MMSLICVFFSLAAGAGQAHVEPPTTAIDWAFSRLYNCDFAGAHAIIDEQIRRHPEDPLLYSVRAVTFLFSEFQRLEILESDFFADNDKVSGRKKLKPDPVVRDELFAMTREARRRAAASLASAPNDVNAIFALSMVSGVEADYASLVEKKYIRSYSLSKESQQFARKLLTMNPPVYDAYLTLGSVEYVIGNLNFFFRLFVRFDQIEGNKQKAVEELKYVITNGRYYQPFAKLLLSVIYLRENQPQKALVLLKEMERDYPENPLFRAEVRRTASRIERGQALGSSAR
jgi:hypothetical protein